MSNGRIVHQLVRTQGKTETELTDSYDLPAIELLRDQMNHEAPPGVVYSVRTVEIHTRPLTVITTTESK